jgi:hypothetical protein
MNSIVLIKKVSDYKASCIGVLGDTFSISAINKDDFNTQIFERVKHQSQLAENDVLVQIEEINGKKNVQRYDKKQKKLVNTDIKVKQPHKPIKKKMIVLPTAASLIIGFAVFGISIASSAQSQQHLIPDPNLKVLTSEIFSSDEIDQTPNDLQDPTVTILVTPTPSPSPTPTQTSPTDSWQQQVNKTPPAPQPKPTAPKTPKPKPSPTDDEEQFFG